MLAKEHISKTYLKPILILSDDKETIKEAANSLKDLYKLKKH
jgi:hypothetical protein